MTRLITSFPLARKTTSRTTSPSSFRLRPSAVYSGFGLSRIVTGVSAGPSFAAFFFGASAAAAGWRNRSAVSEARAGDRAANALVTASAISVAGTAGQGRKTLAHYDIALV